MVSARLHKRRRWQDNGTTSDPLLPSHPAVRADTVFAKFGISGMGGGGGGNAYRGNPTFTASKAIELGARYTRLGRVNVADEGDRTLTAALAAEGITLIGICDDRGTQTPRTRLEEMLNHWGPPGYTKKIAEGINEPQRNSTVQRPAEWAASYTSDGPDGNTEPFGVNEVRRQQELLWAERNALGLTWPVILPSLAVKSKRGTTVDTSWYHRLRSLGTDWPAQNYGTYSNLHRYQGGDPPLDEDQLILTWHAEMDVLAPGLGKVLTENGYHHDATSTTNIYTSETASSRYIARMFFEFYDLFEFWCYYELFDETYLHGHEAKFGMYKDVNPTAGTATAKPQATTVIRMKNLIAEPGHAAFTPQPLRYQVGAAPADFREFLMQRSDGKHILAVWRDVSVFNKGTHTPDVVSPGTDVEVTPVAVTITLQDTKTIEVFDPHVSATPTVSTGKTVTVNLAGNVLLIRLS